MSDAHPLAKAAIEPIKRRKVWEDVADRLRALIQDETFPVGTLLPPERELMALFGVGRPAVREALFALNRMGLVRISTGERASVTRPTAGILVEQLSGPAESFLAQEGAQAQFRDARLLFERGVARVAAERATDEDIDRLAEALQTNEEARGDSRAFERADVAFHYRLACMSGNPIFIAVHEAIVHWLTSQREIALQRENAEEIAIAGHRRVYEAIAKRDPDAADRAMALHLKEIAALVSDET